MHFFSLIRKTSRRYGVIECDPLVRRGLEKTVSIIEIMGGVHSNYPPYNFSFFFVDLMCYYDCLYNFKLKYDSYGVAS